MSLSISKNQNLLEHFKQTHHAEYALLLCLGVNEKPSSTLPRNRSLIHTQSFTYSSLLPSLPTSRLPSTVSNSLRPQYAGTRCRMPCGRSSSPTGTYRHRNDIHSSRKRRVRATPGSSLPQCSSP